jgi:hypothetical protein
MTIGRLRRTLARMERACPVPSRPHLWLACVDDQGRVLDDGSEAARPWVGRHHTELPGPVQVIAGIDPFRVLGRDRTGTS